ncbi:MAG: TraB/GumN family protein, partial [Candidatus Binatia bacterium]
AWKQGDARRLEELLNEPLRQSKDIAPIYRKLLDERNEKMAEKIDGYLATGETYFIIAGAAHLVGDNGLVRLLSRKHRVEQLGK